MLQDLYGELDSLLSKEVEFVGKVTSWRDIRNGKKQGDKDRRLQHFTNKQVLLERWNLFEASSKYIFTLVMFDISMYELGRQFSLLMRFVNREIIGICREGHC